MNDKDLEQEYIVEKLAGRLHYGHHIIDSAYDPATGVYHITSETPAREETFEEWKARKWQ